MNHPGCLTISHKTACIWSTLGGPVAVDCLVQLNSLMHVAGPGLLSQHGWDGGYSFLSAASVHANTHKLWPANHKYTCVWLWQMNMNKLTHACPDPYNSGLSSMMWPREQW